MLAILARVRFISRPIHTRLIENWPNVTASMVVPSPLEKMSSLCVQWSAEGHESPDRQLRSA